jgi:hypothetical protein
VANMNGVSISVAATLLNLSLETMKARVKRAERTQTEFGIDVDLGHGVTASKPFFSKVWIVYIPKRVIAAMVINRKRTRGR